jgi:hypothetical protein
MKSGWRRAITNGSGCAAEESAVASRLLIAGLALSFALGGAAVVSAGPRLSTQAQTTRAWAAAVRLGESKQSCRKSIGLVGARTLVRYCQYVSTASHPPCNSLNNCALIVDEIQRTTVGNDAPLNPHRLPGSEDLKASDWRTIERLHAY